MRRVIEQEKIADIVGVLEGYFEGLYYADSQKLATVLHSDARYVNTVEGDYMNHSMPEYFAIVDSRTSPASKAEDRSDQILSIEFGGDTMASAKVAMTMLGRDYLDFLTLTYMGGQWWIMSKVFSYISYSKDT